MHDGPFYSIVRIIVILFAFGAFICITTWNGWLLAVPGRIVVLPVLLFWVIFLIAIDLYKINNHVYIT